MITNITTKGNLVAYHNTSRPYISPGAQSAGMLRYNVNMQNMEVYDGVSWLTFGGACEVSLSGETEMIIAWAREKMLEEKRIDELCEKHPGLRKARDHYEMFKRLIASEEQVQPG